MDGVVDASTTEQGGVGRVDDGVNGKGGDVDLEGGDAAGMIWVAPGNIVMPQGRENRIAVRLEMSCKELMAASRAILSAGTDGIESHIGVRELKSVDVQRGLAIFQVRSASGKGPNAPDFPVPIGAILPNRAEDTLQFWQMLVDSLMALLREQNQYPDFLRGYEVSIGEDSSGEPGLYVTLKIARPQSYQGSTVRRWNAFSSLLLDLLLRLGIQRYPYIRLQEKRGSR